MKKVLLSALLAGFALITSCKEDDDMKDSNPSTLPTSYNFENVDHSGQDIRLEMLDIIIKYSKTSNDGNAVDGSVMIDMFTNDNYTWNDPTLDNSTKDISSKLAPEAQARISGWISELETISENPGTGSNGTAGLVSNGNKTYLNNENGFEIAQLLEKGCMGALAYYQATAVYLSDAKMDVDNSEVIEGEGTAMQHHWDEAFGYWGVPKDFGTAGFTYDSQANYHRFWAKYTNEVNDVLGSNAKIMNAFIKGRDAINREDYNSRDAAIAEIRENWEEVAVGMAIHYLNGAKADIADDALRNHQLSEAYGFIWSLQFNPSQKITDNQIQDILDVFTNLYEVSIQDLNNTIDELADYYDLKEVKDQL